MKYFLYLLIIFAAGCATYENQPYTTPHRYSPNDLSLHLSQDNNSDLLLELHNETSSPITNKFSQTIFEGNFYFIQESALPAKAYPKDYFNLLIHATWCVPNNTIAPHSSLHYRVALHDLVLPTSSFQPKKEKKILVYALMDKFEIISNAIELKNHKTMKWSTITGKYLQIH
jgi:hypothetical protein